MGDAPKRPAKPRAPAKAARAAGTRRAKKAPAPEPRLIDPTGDAPLHELSRDALSAFLYAALTPEEALGLVKQLGLGRPGFRQEALAEVETCDYLADELRAHPPSRIPVLDVLRAGLKAPAFPGSTLDAAAADELLEVTDPGHGLAIALWRLVADPQPEVRARGAAALERLAAEWYGPGPGGAEGERGVAEGQGPRAGGGEAGLQALQEKLAKAESRLETERQRVEQVREKLQGQVKEARAEAARAVEESARLRQAAEGALAAQGRAEAALAALRASDASAELTRLKASSRELEVRLHAAEAEGARSAERAAALQGALAQAQARAQAEAASGAPGAAAPPTGGSGEGGDEPEEAPAAWLLPVFTSEFYDSLVGWDRRIQRAALKQAFLLSQDHHHPSLRALPLQGLPGYYRVRVATDVRLIYRRGERQDTVELCSLIDREDLDRYVRQAKTR